MSVIKEWFSVGNTIYRTNSFDEITIIPHDKIPRIPQNSLCCATKYREVYFPSKVSGSEDSEVYWIVVGKRGDQLVDIEYFPEHELAWIFLESIIGKNL